MSFTLRIEQAYNRIFIKDLTLEEVNEFVACFGGHLGADISLTIRTEDELKEEDK